MRSIRLALWPFIFLLASSLGVTHAQPLPDAPESAKQLFERGVEQFRHKEFEQAVVSFDRSYALRPVPEVRFNAALALRALNRHAEASHALEGFLTDAQAQRGGLEPGRRAQVEKLLAESRLLTEKVELSLSPGDAQVAIDNRPAASVSGPIYLDPGPHRFHASRSGYVAADVELVAQAGRTQRITIAMVAAPLSPVARVEPPPTPASSTTQAAPVAAPAGANLVASAAPKRPLYKRWWLWTTVGVVAAGAIATGLAVGLTAPHDAPAPADATRIHF